MRLVDLNNYLMELGKKVNGIKLFGVLKGEVIAPNPINTLPLVEDTICFALMDILGFEHNGSFYWTSGEILAPISEYNMNEVKKKPTKRQLVSLSGGRLELTHHNIIAVYKFAKVDGVWATGKTYVQNVSKDENPELIKMVIESFKNNWEYAYPNGIAPYEGYEEASSGFQFQYTQEWEQLRTEGDSYVPDNTIPRVPVERIDTTKGYTSNYHDNSTAPNPFGVVSQQHSLPPQPVGEYLQPPQEQTNYPNPSATDNLGIQDTFVPQSGINPIAAGKSVVKNPLVSRFNPEGKASKLTLANPNLRKLDYHRLEPIEKSEFHENYVTAYNDSIGRVEEAIEIAKKVESKKKPLTSIVKIVKSGLRTHWQRQLLFSRTTEKWFSETLKYLYDEHWYGEGKPVAQHYHIDEALLLNGAGVLDCLENPDTLLMGNNMDELTEISQSIYNYASHIALMKVEYLLEIPKGGLLGLLNARALDDVNVNQMISTNSYMLGLMNPSLRFEALEKLRMLFGYEVSPEMERVRNALKVHNFLLNPNERGLEGSTLHLRKDLEQKLKIGFKLTAKKYADFLRSGDEKAGSIFDEKRAAAIETFFSGAIKPEELYVPKDGWERTSTGHVLMGNSSTKKTLQDAIDLGVVTVIGSPIDGQEYITDTGILRKELYLYDKLYDMLSVDVPDVTEEELAQYKLEFEALKDEELDLPAGTFKLELRQEQAGKLLAYNTGILTGGAGSGKTTSAEFLVYVALKVRGVSPEAVYFAAPTGKAAQRLSEVVKRKAYTINSMFGIGIGTWYPLTADHFDGRKVLEEEGGSILFIDEGSIANTDLLYDVMCKINHQTTSVYFLGDDDQLPPIGFGKPFASMLTFLPTIHLNVSKRAAEGSNITLNANRVIDPLDKGNLTSARDFKIIDGTNADEGLAKLKMLLHYHIGTDGTTASYAGNLDIIETVGRGLTSENIQILSPYSNPKTSATASKAVNRIVQDIFNPINPSLPTVVYTSPWDNVRDQLRINDKVIHVNSNLGDKPRWSYDESRREFKLLDSAGVFNGDVGYVKTIVPLRDLNLSLGKVEADKIPDEAMRMLKINWAEKERYGAEGTLPKRDIHYMAIRYDGVSNAGLPIRFYTLYAFIVNVHNGNYLESELLELRNVELAYCLSTHKMQGSQGDLVIGLYYPQGAYKAVPKPFVSRNMIYTGVTRAKKGFYGMGDFYSPSGVINNGRKYQANSARSVLFDVY